MGVRQRAMKMEALTTFAPGDCGSVSLRDHEPTTATCRS
jgi:hypothetical protein